MLSQELNEKLVRVGPGTEMGAYLRRYWHPIAPTAEVEKLGVKAVRLLGEDLVLYQRGERAHGLLRRRCPHRGMDLSQGWTEQGALRCPYHGWLFDHQGACVAQPFGQAAGGSGIAPGSGTHAYPTAVLGGLIWAYLGPAPAPALPLLEPFTWHGFVQLIVSEVPCNWFQCQENSMDPVHFEWLHLNWSAAQAGLPADGGIRHLEIGFEEFEFGFSCTRSTSGEVDAQAVPWRERSGQLQSADLICLWPNALYAGNHIEWRVPVDDENTLSVVWWHSPLRAGEAVDPAAPVPYWYAPLDDPTTGLPLSAAPMNQDIAAWLGQGRIADRTTERLGRSDAGVALLRRSFLRELRTTAQGAPARALRPAADAVEVLELPLTDKTRTLHRDGIPAEQFAAVSERLDRSYGPCGPGFAFQAGQPEAVRRAYLEAMHHSGGR